MWQFDFDREEYSSELQCVGVLQHFQFLNHPESELSEVFDKLKIADKKALPYLGNNIIREPSSCFLDKIARRAVEKYSNNSSIYGWHIVDEPEGRNISAACQLQLYSEIKGIDPHTPVVVSTNSSRSEAFEHYLDVNAFDILTFHRYVNPVIDKAQVRQQREIGKLDLTGKKLLVTLRAFNSPKPRRVDITAKNITDQLEHYLTTPPELDGVGFYGWQLAPNTGISQSDVLSEGYEALTVGLIEAGMCP